MTQYINLDKVDVSQTPVPVFPEGRVAGSRSCHVRDVMALTLDEIWLDQHLLGDGEVLMTMDDGEVVRTMGRRVIWCRYIWDCLTQFPDAQITEECNLGMGRVSESKFGDIVDSCYQAMIDAYDDRDGYDRDDFKLSISKMINRTYNDYTKYLAEFAMGISGREIYEFFNYPPIKERYLKLQPYQADIDRFKDHVMNLIYNDPDFPKGIIRDAFLSNLASKEQMMQSLVIIGFRTEINSRIFQEPIMVPYSKGIRSEYDASIEAQNSTKSPIYNKDEMGDAQYYNRKMQIVGSFIHTLSMDDCGTDVMYDWTVEPGEFKYIQGMYYLTQDDIKNGRTRLRYIKPRDKHLIGQTIKVRLIFGCAHPDQGTVCEKCYGRIGRNIPRGSVPGWISSNVVGGEISQKTLKVKHEDGIGALDGVEVAPEYSGYLKTSSDPYSYRLNSDLKGARVLMTLKQDEAECIPDLEYTENLDDVTAVAQSKFSTLRLNIIWEEEGVEDAIDIPVAIGQREAYLSKDMLNYIATFGYTLNKDEEYVVDLSAWSFDKLFISVPNRHNSIVAYKNEVQAVIIGTSTFGKGKKPIMNSYGGTVEAIKTVLNLVTTKLKANYTHIATVIYSMAARDPDNYDFKLPKRGESYEFCTLTEVLKHRSVCGILVYQGAEYVFDKPYTYVVKDRPKHIADPLFMRFRYDMYGSGRR